MTRSKPLEPSMRTPWQGLPPAATVTGSIALALQLVAQRQAERVFLAPDLTV
jgi:hypothetical protein